MGREDKSTWKSNYFLKLLKFLEEYPKCFIVGVDNVGSRQMQEIRMSLRGRAELLMGKNTMIKKAIKGYLPKNPQLASIMDYIVGNVGFVFTQENLAEVREAIISKKVAAPAKAGTVAPMDVKLPAQNTGLGPEKTSFFQALSIPTKISKGTIEILNEVHLIKANEKVGASEAALLNMLNIMPFSYGLVMKKVYDNGSVYDPSILDVSAADLCQRVRLAVRAVASISLQINYPNAASAPHMIANALKALMAMAAETDVTFKEAEKMKEYLKDPSKFAAAAAPAAAAVTSAAASAPAAAKEEKKEESDEEEGMGGLFDM